MVWKNKSTGTAGLNFNIATGQETVPGSNPMVALHSLQVSPIPVVIAKKLLERAHYLHSLPGGTQLAFGVFLGSNLLGAMTLGAGPFNSHSLVEKAKSVDCLTLTRLWLSDKLPFNSESRVISIVLRALQKHTNVRFLLSYADPSYGHLGTIYQATNWLYTGLSEAMPLYDIGDGILHHSRSLSHTYGSHSIAHFRRHGIQIKLIPQKPKHRYLYFLDPTWQERLLLTVLPYPKKEDSNGYS